MDKIQEARNKNQEPSMSARSESRILKKENRAKNKGQLKIKQMIGFTISIPRVYTAKNSPGSSGFCP
ncbi:MAG: hypothetical protein OEX02_03135 [Cyclobacteriaceae bacterium]|nr:hypothetical protein [Cyclobacteriaceae bacterium]